MAGDLHTGQQWMTPDHFPAALRTQLQPILQGPPQPIPDRHIHPGQFWHLSPALQQQLARTIYEIFTDRDPKVTTTHAPGSQ